MSSDKKLFIKFADENNLKKVQECLDLGVDVNATDGDFEFTAAHKAAIRGHFEVIQLLAANDQMDWKKTDKQGWTPLHVALYKGQYEVAEIILQQDKEKLNLNLRTRWQSYTIAHLAVMGEIIPCVDLLAKQENCQCWNIPDQGGDTPIMDTIRLANPDILKILLECPRVDPNMKNRDGDSPLMMAIKREEVDMTRILIKSPRVDLRIKDRAGSTLQRIAR